VSSSSLLGLRSDQCVMLMNAVDVSTDIPPESQQSLLQLALPMSCRDSVVQQLSDDPSAVSLVCLSARSCSIISSRISSSRGWWLGVVVTRFIRYCMPGRVSTAMGDCLQAGKPFRYVTSHLGQLSFLSLWGR